MELYFIDDVPKLIYDTWKYARVRPNCQEFTHHGSTYYICDARDYSEAIEQLVYRSQQYAKNSMNEQFKLSVIAATNLIIDPIRGDGFSFMFSEFERWHELLENHTVPEEYK